MEFWLVQRIPDHGLSFSPLPRAVLCAAFYVCRVVLCVVMCVVCRVLRCVLHVMCSFVFCVAAPKYNITEYIIYIIT